MTSDFLAKWIKKKRKEKGFSIKEFHRRIQDHIERLGLPKKFQRSYAWFSGLERYGVAKDDLILINSLLDFFGYKLVLVRSDIKKDNLSPEDIKEITEICTAEEQEKEKYVEEKIGNKNW